MARRKNNQLDALFADLRSKAQERKKGTSWHQKAASLRQQLMQNQARLEQDLSRRVAVRSPRQTGKSTGVMLITLIRCFEKAGSEWVVIGLTRPSIKRIYWEALKALSQAYELGLKFQHQELICTLPNGSRIYFVGADNIGEIEKLRGGRYDGVVVDECKSFPPSVFKELIQDVIHAALMAKNGQLYVIGTPGDDLRGPFFEATCDDPIVLVGAGGVKRLTNAPYGTTPQYPAIWSLHKWTMEDNTTRFEDGKGGHYTMWDQALKIKDDMGYADDNPTWRREFLGHWVAGLRDVFRYRPHLHDYVPCDDTPLGLPPEVADAQWRRVIGCDLGTRDGTAFVVWAYSPTEPGLWELYSEKRTREPGERFPVSEVAAWYKELEDRFGPFDGWPCDPAGLGTMVIDTLAADHGVYLEAAEKKEKLDHIELFNNDLDAGLIHIREGSPLSGELLAGRWAEKPLEKGKREEDPGIPNDIADAAVYGFRFCRHRAARKEPPGVAIGSESWWAQVAAKELEDAKRRAREAEENLSNNLDSKWWV